MARTAAEVFKSHGDLGVVGRWADEVVEGKVTDFWRAIFGGFTPILNTSV
ncbi:DUF1428 family protein [Sphingomonas quercus]|uniref:DUF1428 domain-containing protein n=1 Tax=Sphingomonas quercus TaxID=2842451 RepID=A0ABS6BHP5_9SPHN|nr:DUF1428 family protein [Sphingomonas quercus]MBU3077704.1 DUF1428 domain-containing protein [Sphingomonas quercus]